ncbi:YtcA family lipoprotein [Pectobacteriaceae bacterium C111]|nr:YtcA family lipoprotein [Pectobacteriaceae bacterium C111]
MAIALFMLSGCVAQQAPVFSLLGFCFPGWIVCALLGIVAAVIAWVIFIRLGIDDALPARLLVYACLALAVTFISSPLIFAR